MPSYDIAIVGAGPAGLFASISLAEEIRRGRARLIVFDEGPPARQRSCPMRVTDKCTNCRPCTLLQGVGGAGALSSGIINIRPDVGGDLHKLLESWVEAQKLVEAIDRVLLFFGAPRDRLYEPDPAKTAELERKAIRAGAKFIPIKQRHIGTENTVKIVENITSYLLDHKIVLSPLTRVHYVEKKNNYYTLKTSRGEVVAKYVLLAPGRSGATWLAEQARKLGLVTEPGPLDVGVRVEVPYTVMEPLTSVVRDPKVIFHTKTFDDRVRTFCTNYRGFVVKEVYDDGTVGVNGETYAYRESINTNFAFLVTIKLTDPLEDALDYGKSIARLATKLGGGKPLLQRLGDLLSGRRSTWDRIDRSIVEPTLKDVVPGDIGMALPQRLLTDILEGLEKLDDLAPGIWSKHTLLYAPEIKYYSLKIRVEPKTMETNIENLFVAGDGAGLSRGINIAAATGYLAAQGIASKLGLEPKLPEPVEKER